jgi:hypothetical protein
MEEKKKIVSIRSLLDGKSLGDVPFEGEFSSFAFTSDGKLLAIVTNHEPSQDPYWRDVSIFDVGTSKRIKHFEYRDKNALSELGRNTFTAIMFVPPDDKHFVLTERYDSKNLSEKVKDPDLSRFLYFVDSSDGTVMRKFPAGLKPGTTFTKDGKYLLFGRCLEERLPGIKDDYSFDGVLTWLDLTTGQTHDSAQFCSAPLNKLVFSPDLKYFAYYVARWGEQRICIASIETNEMIATKHVDEHEFISAIAFSPGGQYVIYGPKPSLSAWHWQSGSSVYIAGPKLIYHLMTTGQDIIIRQADPDNVIAVYTHPLTEMDEQDRAEGNDDGTNDRPILVHINDKQAKLEIHEAARLAKEILDELAKRASKLE